jgi:choline dehydrogenase
MADYVIVGGGSAGCALAGRLAQADVGKIVVLEAGPRDTNPLIHIPAGFVKLLDSKLL